jgi:nicotinamidase-related amidase
VKIFLTQKARKMELNPARTAILTLDVQNDLVDVTKGVNEGGILDRMASIIAAGRAKGCTVIHITASARVDFADIPRNNPLWINVRQQKLMIAGTKGAAIHEKIAPLDSELVLNKTSVDPFLTTSLQQALHNADANTLILVGLWTNYVVEATARHASDIGYRVFIVSDCCASNDDQNHRFAVERILPTLSYIVNTDEVLAALK